MRRRGGRKRALGTRAPMPVPQGPNQRWSLDFCQRRLHRRPPLPDPDGGRRLHPGVPGAGRRHLAVGAAGRARARCHHRRARPACHVRLRQRHRADQHGDPALVAGDGRSTGTTSRPASRRRTPSSRASTAASATSCSTRRCSPRSPRPATLWPPGRTTTTPSGRTARSAICRQPNYAKLSAPDTQRDGTLRYVEGSAPRPVAPPSQ